MSKWIQLKENSHERTRIGYLTYRRSSGEPYVNWTLELSGYQKEETDTFSLATVQSNQQSLYLAFYFEKTDGESGMLTSRTVSLPKGVPAGSEVKITLKGKQTGTILQLFVDVNIPKTGTMDRYVAGPETKGYLMLKESNRELPVEYDADP